MRHERRKRIAKKRRSSDRRARLAAFYETFRRMLKVDLFAAIQWSQLNAWVPWD